MAFVSNTLLAIMVACVVAETSCTVIDSPSKGSAPISDNRISAAPLNNHRDEAYITLLYGDFVLGVRVLGLSIKNSGTDREMIVVCAEGVSQETKDILVKDGWTVKSVHSRGEVGPNLITKLEIWKLTQYRRLIFLDADTMVVQNIDDLFRCGSFCVVYRAYDLFNSGVMVLKPSFELYKQLVSEIPLLEKSRQVHDQDLLNLHYKSLCYDRMHNASDNIYHEEPMRLHSGYNTDTVVYYWWSRWLIDEDQVKIIHFTLPPIKPWKWWAFPLFDLHWRWNAVREMLVGHDTEPSIWSVRNYVPMLVFLLIFASLHFFFRMLCFKHKFSIKQPLLNKIAAWLGPVEGKLSKIFPTVSLCFSFYISVGFVPSTMPPYQAIVLYSGWVLLFECLLYTMYIMLACVLGNHTSSGYPKNYHTRAPGAKVESVFWLFALMLMILVLFYVPLGIAKFNRRLRTFVMLFVFCLVCGHFVGRRMIRVWVNYLSVHTRDDKQTLPTH